MKKTLLVLACCFVSISNAQEPIFDPTMVISGLGTVNSPIGEEVDKIIDGDINTKFLDFELGDGMGFTVNLGGVAATANSITLTTANDFPERDPIEFEVLGSNDAVNYTSLLLEDLPCITDRFNSRSFPISNTDSYLFYRINFSAPCDPSGGTGIPSIQLAEAQLFEDILGVSENRLSNNQFTMAPNPSNGQFTISYTGSTELESLSIADVTGKTIQTSSLRGFSQAININMDNSATGIYFVTISSNSRFVVKRIIIQ